MELVIDIDVYRTESVLEIKREIFLKINDLV